MQSGKTSAYAKSDGLIVRVLNDEHCFLDAPILASIRVR